MRMRDYHALMRDMARHTDLSLLGYTDDTHQFPLYTIYAGSGIPILLSAGIHGNEPAGVYAIREFVRHHLWWYRHTFEFTILPCINPWGFAHDNRLNSAGQDLNSEWYDEPKAREIALIVRTLSSYALCIDLHETGPNDVTMGTTERLPHEFFMWEICVNKKNRIGKRMIDNIRRETLPVCEWNTICGEKNSGGVIWYPEGQGKPKHNGEIPNWFDEYIMKTHTRHSITLETPLKLERQWRIRGALAVLRTALEEASRIYRNYRKKR